MNKVENIEQLRTEIARLKIVAKQKEQDIKNDFKNIEEEFQPANLLWKGFASIAGVNMSKNEFFKDGIAYGLSLLIQRFILKSERKMEDKVYDVVDTIFEKTKSFINRFTNAQARREERKAEQ